MKPKIIGACPNIQIGGIPKASSVEHLVTMKTWMKVKEETKGAGIIQTFDMKKFFNKESLLDTMYTLKTKANIDNKDYRLWYKLNENTRIRVKNISGRIRCQTSKEQSGPGIIRSSPSIINQHWMCHTGHIP
jgi:hypothetical protein